MSSCAPFAYTQDGEHRCIDMIKIEKWEKYNLGVCT